MQEFTIGTPGEKTSEHNYYIYISFNEEPLESGRLVTCSGAALIMPDGKTKYWFLYHFLHSRDWKRVLKIRIQPKAHTFSAIQLKEFGKQIVNLINFYVAQSN